MLPDVSTVFVDLSPVVDKLNEMQGAIQSGFAQVTEQLAPMGEQSAQTVEYLADIKEQLAENQKEYREISLQVMEIQDRITSIADSQKTFSHDSVVFIVVCLGAVVGSIIGKAFLSQWRVQ